MADLKINITATGGQASAEEIRKATAATGALAEASKKVASASKDSGEALTDFGKRGSAAKDAFEGVSMAANGGAGAIFGFSKAWVNLKEAFAANPITAILAILLGTLGLVQKGFDLLVQRAEAARDKLFGTGEQTKKTAESMAALEAATKAALQGAATDASELRREVAALNSTIDTTLSRFKLLETSRTNFTISGINVARQNELNGATNPEQIDAINKRYDQQVDTVKGRSSANTLAAESQALLNKISVAINKQGEAEFRIRDAQETARAKIGTADGPRERAASEKIVTEITSKSTAEIAQLEDAIAGYQTELRAIRYQERTGINTTTAAGIATAREERAAVAGRGIASAKSDALDLAGRAGSFFTPEIYKEDFGVSTERRKADRAALGERNTARQASIAAAAAGVEQAAQTLGDGQDEAADLGKLEAALTRLANAAGLRGSATLQKLVERIDNLEAQLKNGDRR